MIQRCKALFSEKKIVRHLRGQIDLPNPLPFSDVEFFESQPTQYYSKIDVVELLGKAQSSLGAAKGKEEKDWEFRKRIEAFKILLLAVFAGLRRGEIDTLKWEQIDFVDQVIWLEETDVMRLKSSGSSGAIHLESEVLNALERLRKWSPPGPFVIHSSLGLKHDSKNRRYRANKHFKTLSKWLKHHGVDDTKPIHVLRKEAGSLINEKGGIIAAQRFLRHADSRTTAKHYLDVKSKTTVGLGGFLNVSEE